MSETIGKSIYDYGRDILSSEEIKAEKTFMQHGDTSVYEHSLNVAYLSLYIVRRMNIRVDASVVGRGEMGEDYFL